MPYQTNQPRKWRTKSTEWMHKQAQEGFPLPTLAGKAHQLEFFGKRVSDMDMVELRAVIGYLDGVLVRHQAYVVRKALDVE